MSELTFKNKPNMEITEKDNIPCLDIFYPLNNGKEIRFHLWPDTCAYILAGFAQEPHSDSYEVWGYDGILYYISLIKENEEKKLKLEIYNENTKVTYKIILDMGDGLDFISNIIKLEWIYFQELLASDNYDINKEEKETYA